MMEEQLRKLVEYAGPKPKSFICVSVNTSRLKTLFHHSSFHLHLVTKWLLQAWKRTIYFPINATNNHLNVSFDDGKTWMGTRIPTGC